VFDYVAPCITNCKVGFELIHFTLKHAVPCRLQSIRKIDLIPMRPIVFKSPLQLNYDDGFHFYYEDSGIIHAICRCTNFISPITEKTDL
jgi:hypothetical protein